MINKYYHIEKFRRACDIERIVRRDHLDDEADAADIALAFLEEDPSMTDEQIAARVARTIQQT